MSVGYRIHSPEEFGKTIMSTPERRGMRCYALSHVVEGPKKVIIGSKRIVYQ